MPKFTDQTGRSVAINSNPSRIISLVPSQTELLYSLGLNEEVIGITKFCIHPEGWFRSKRRIGGTKQLNIEQIRELKPDLVLGNKEENVKDQIEILEQEFPVWLSNVNNLDDATRMINDFGLITDRGNEAANLTKNILQAFSEIPVPKTRKKCIYLIWDKPMMAVGSNTFIDSMLHLAGLDNSIGNLTRYPEITSTDICRIQPELLILSSEPYPFSQDHVERFSLQYPFAKIILANGEMFSWYGSRLMMAADYFKHTVSKW